MSTIEEERSAYERNPYFTGHIYGNFSPFYVTIAICTVVLGSIIILNIILGCCSKYRKYWQDRHTGNRWLVSIWSATPHKQPPLDFTELKDGSYFQSLHPTTHQQVFPEEVIVGELEPVHQQHHHQQRPPRPEGRTLHQQRQREEYVELQKRESDI
ncbi:uncharacterized protein LOC115622904 [Scaptodrosophila lebanonensis]|uniref:Uncharacterized protein LOC115622904 n=1 Tax=Drosophila lebanonensis TaxID=7225 RepID=A0A6J2TD26_DROLE|nr:uncharacterized protein LOC115622904 [Scaptodrosophila lebanonensis]